MKSYGSALAVSKSKGGINVVMMPLRGRRVNRGRKKWGSAFGTETGDG